MEKQAIMVVSSGSTRIESLERTVGEIEREIRETYPECEVRRAFSSGAIRKRLNQRGVSAPSTGEVLEQLCRNGFSRVTVLSAHILPGEGYHKLLTELDRYRDRFASLTASKPLLYDTRDLMELSRFLMGAYPLESGEALVLMGHGSEHLSGSVYSALNFVFRDLGAKNYFVATVDGEPGFSQVLDRLREDGYRKVRLAPLMLTAGEHVRRDMAGDGADSWKNRCLAAGLEVSAVLSGLGEFPPVRRVFLRHLRECGGVLRKGTLYGVSVGPGDPELITVKAMKILKGCAVIATPRIHGAKTVALDIARQAVDLSDKEILYLDHRMVTEEETLRKQYRENTSAVASFLEQGKDVAMLNLGDVSVYSTYSYIAREIQTLGFACRMIPGVTSFCACAALLGRSLTDAREPLSIFPGSYDDLQNALDTPGGKVLMKSARALPALREAIREKGLEEKTAVVSDCGLPTQAVHTIEDDISSYFTTVLIAP